MLSTKLIWAKSARLDPSLMDAKSSSAALKDPKWRSWEGSSTVQVCITAILTNKLYSNFIFVWGSSELICWCLVGFAGRCGSVQFDQWITDARHRRIASGGSLETSGAVVAQTFRGDYRMGHSELPFETSRSRDRLFTPGIQSRRRRFAQTKWK